MPVVSILNSLSEVEDKILEHELESTTKFITQRVSNSKHLNIRIEDVTSLEGHKVQWKDTQANDEPEICFDGIPYINVGWMTKECQNGPDRHKKKKAKYKKEKENDKEDHGYIKKTRRHIQDTKKLDCPARIRLRIIVKFQQFKLAGFCQPVDSKIIFKNKTYPTIEEGKRTVQEIQNGTSECLSAEISAQVKR
ncbi:unnamed protein product [Mytilus coruscus]|uniref:Uncharacterized protein n=1 Tax=Mytilus coruscus TaxID=42192 RepID=A0A6J8A403_MYTCO|nr:unnamed protein product [Mytilus coruscus]